MLETFVERLGHISDRCSHHCVFILLSHPSLKVLAPYLILTQLPASFVLHALFAHWLLLNIAFHYYMVVRTPPGAPPRNGLNDELLVVRQKGEGYFATLIRQVGERV